MNSSDHEKILVTGISGQVGTALTKYFEELGKQLLGIDVKPTSITHNIDFMQIDLTDKNSISQYKEKLRHVTVLIHLASLVNDTNDIVKHSIDSIELNIQGILNLLEFLPSLKHMTFASSYMVYGSSKTQLINENHPTSPQNIYGVSKLMAEKYLQIFSEKKNFSLCILRFMGIYGPKTPLSDRAIPTFIHLIESNQKPTLFGAGKAKRNHVYMDDAVNAILLSLQIKNSTVLNIGGDDPISNLELIHTINNILKKNIEPICENTNTDEFDFIVDTTRARKEIDFSPKTKMKTGLTAQIDYKKEGNHNEL